MSSNNQSPWRTDQSQYINRLSGPIVQLDPMKTIHINNVINGYNALHSDQKRQFQNDQIIRILDMLSVDDLVGLSTQINDINNYNRRPNPFGPPYNNNLYE